MTVVPSLGNCLHTGSIWMRYPWLLQPLQRGMSHAG